MRVVRGGRRPPRTTLTGRKMPLAGWYPDPSAEHDSRFWTGAAWTERVVSFGVETQWPLHPPAIPDVESMLIQQDLLLLSTHRVWIQAGRAVADGYLEFQLWQVADVQVQQTGGQSLLGTAMVRLLIAYPGYTGRASYVLRGLENPIAAATTVRAWTRRSRRFHGLG